MTKDPASIRKEPVSVRPLHSLMWAMKGQPVAFQNIRRTKRTLTLHIQQTCNSPYILRVKSFYEARLRYPETSRRDCPRKQSPYVESKWGHLAAFLRDEIDVQDSTTLTISVEASDTASAVL